MRRQILRLAIPNIVTNITVPLVGIADLAIAGRLADDLSLAAVVIGTTIFNFIYWNFGFLRMGTSGFASQSFGAGNFDECARVLIRSLSLAFLFAAIILILQMPIAHFAIMLTESSESVERMAIEYFYARIWGAPAVLALYAMKGWFIGMQNPKSPMWIAIIINVVNIAVSIVLALNLNMGIRGIGIGSAIGQWSGVLVAVAILLFKYRKIFINVTLRQVFRIDAFKRVMTVNTDIFIRTLCLVAVFTYFTIASSYHGDDMVAANALLLQLFTLFSYMMDGFAYAAESLCGRFYGAKDAGMLRKSVIHSLEWGVYLSVVVTLIYLLLCRDILTIFNPSDTILELALQYKWYIIAVPLCSFAAFVLDGVLVGVTASSIMRNVMIVASAIFFALFFIFEKLIGNNSLWIAFLVYLLLRGLLQFFLSREIILPKGDKTLNCISFN